MGANFTQVASGNFSLPVGAQVNEIFLADLNGDGKLDALMAYQFIPNVTREVGLRVVLGDGRGGFTEGTSTVFPGGAPTTVAPRDHAYVDFTGDGRPDLFIVDQGYDASPFPGYHNTLAINQGTTFADKSSSLPSSPDFTHTMSVADIDRDGDNDIYVGNIYSNGRIGPYFLVNDGRGNFTSDNSRMGLVSNLSEGRYTSSAFIDVDGDGDQDLFLGSDGERVINTGADGVSIIMINDGSGHFSTSSMQIPAGRPGHDDIVVDSTTMDVNNDGRPDLILSLALDNYKSGGAAQILINTGTGFVDGTSSTLLGYSGGALVNPQFIYRALTPDVDGDGFNDIVFVWGFSTANSPVYLNDGSGHFVKMPGLLTNLDAWDRFAVGDVNGDGRLDFVAEGTDGNGGENFRTYLNQDMGITQYGTAGNDGLMGDSDTETMYGGGGDDVISGGIGDDFLRGEEGNDTIIGGPGFDYIHGNQGNDVEYGGGGPDWVVGGQGNDLLSGDDGDDVVYSNLGADTCFGGAGQDWVRGGQADDLLYGGAGDDFMSGDRGSDTLSGGVGADRFNFFVGAGIDRITDFNSFEGDRIQFEAAVSYTVSQQGADTIIDLGNGDQLILVGVSQSSLGTWFV